MNIIRRPETCRFLLGLLPLLVATASHGATLEFRFADDASGSFQSRGWMAADSLFQRNLRAAGARWGALINSTQTVVVKVVPNTTLPRFGGGMTFGSAVPRTDGLLEYQIGSLAKVLAGSNPGNATEDIVLTVNPAFSDQWYWPDTSPETRDIPVPTGKTDLVSIALHELGHGLGMSARRSFDAATYGDYYDNVRSPYDVQTAYSGDGRPLSSTGQLNALYFTGPVARMANGAQNLQLTFLAASSSQSSQNYSHIDCGTDNTHRNTLMNGCQVPTDGSRLKTTLLDLAVIADIGYPLHSVFFADTGTLLTAVPLTSGGATRMIAALLRLVDPANLILELDPRNISDSMMPNSDARFDAASGTATIDSMALNDSTAHYQVVLQLIPSTDAKLRFQVTSVRQVAF